jgi:2'-hydroxyisoflavone reductase
MRTRRDLLLKTIALAAVSSGSTGLQAGDDSTAAIANPRRILILGGTGATGRYYVRAALNRGHSVAVFSRGMTLVNLPPTVESLLGDRNGDLRSITNRDWDAVIDVATYGPGWVRSLGRALKGRVKHYTFISTVNVYDRPANNTETNEDSPVLAYHGDANPYSITQEGEYYGAAKALCEQEAVKQFPGNVLVLRPGYIGGPDDIHGNLIYWAVRAQKSGTILAAGDPATPVQFIDVRDLAEWMIRLIERKTTGTYNAIGPDRPADQAQLIEAALRNAVRPTDVNWVPLDWLASRKDKEFWGTLLYWEINRGYLTRISNKNAIENGLTTRPIRVTLADTLAWYKQLSPEYDSELMIKRENGPGFEVIQMPWPDYLNRESEVIAAWKATKAGKI